MKTNILTNSPLISLRKLYSYYMRNSQNGKQNTDVVVKILEENESTPKPLSIFPT